MEQQSFYTPLQQAQSFAEQALKKSNMPTLRFVVFSILGGGFIAVGGLFSIIIAGGFTDAYIEMPGLLRLLAGITFPVGLVLVVVAGAGLFTSDCATVPFALWRKQITYQQSARLLVIGYLANFAGALFVAWLLAYQSGTVSKEPWLGYITQLGIQKTSYSFTSVFLKGMGANLLVCLAVWMATAAKDIPGKVIVIWLPIMAFVALGWEHSIANMFFIPLAMLEGAPITIEAFLLQNLLPATLGNMAGGLLLVALPYYYQWGSAEVVSSIEKRTSAKRKHPHTHEIKSQEILHAIKQHQHENSN